MSDPATGHRFNDDLLANKGDLARAHQLYPRIAHVLDHPAMRALFKDYDDPANSAKRRSLIAGVAAIFLGVFSLLVAAAEPIHKFVSSDVWFWLAVSSGAAGLLSLFIGLTGVMFWTAKSNWLRRRLMTERLRQFHFQTLVCRMPEIIASCAGKSAAQLYTQERERWFAQFRNRHEGKLDLELETILNSDETIDFWLHPVPERVPAEAMEDVASEVFAAYRDLRIMHQLQYAEHKLRGSSSIVPTTPKSQAALFSNASLLCISALLLVHILIAFATPLGWKELVFSPWTHLAAIWIAIGALGIRALEEGLKPDRELERYLHYRSAVRAVRDRFDSATTAAEKIEMMKEMERLVFDEMCDFLRTQSEARFVM